MERELTLATLTLTTCGAALFVSGAVSRRGRLWTPPAAAALVFSALVGWGLQEPDVTGERSSPLLGVLALLIAAIWGRALIRAVLAALPSRRPRGLACTVGMLRPRVVIDPELARVLDDAELRAVVEHERAHARRLDPLRIWLAQLVTDLQWPFPGARARWAAWRRALEISCDDEARARGVHGTDLASAIVKVAQLARGRAGAGAALVEGVDLEARIARLLGSAEVGPERRDPAYGALPLLAACIVLAVAVGRAFGEPLVRAVAALQ